MANQSKMTLKTKEKLGAPSVRKVPQGVALVSKLNN